MRCGEQEDARWGSRARVLTISDRLGNVDRVRVGGKGEWVGSASVVKCMEVEADKVEGMMHDVESDVLSTVGLFGGGRSDCDSADLVRVVFGIDS